MAVDTRPGVTEQPGELDALIEEARRRARRRRLGYLAGAVAALLAAGAFLRFGGGGDGNTSGELGSVGPHSAPALSSSHSAAGNPCRQLFAPVQFVRTAGAGKPGGPVRQLAHPVAGCEFRFDAVLPDGWYQGHARTTVFPPGLEGLGPFPVEYSSSPALGGETRPFSMASGHIAIDISPASAATPQNLAKVQAIALQPSDFRPVNNRRHTDFAHTRLVFGGWRFQAAVYIGAGQGRGERVTQANDLLNSIHTTERECPCK